MNCWRPRILHRWISTRERIHHEAEVMQALREVMDPMVQKDLVTLARIKNLQVAPEAKFVSFDIDTPSPVLKYNDVWKKQCIDRMERLPWVESHKIQWKVAAPRNNQARKGSALAKVANIIAVSSCKGGVGKSTVSVNLAYSLQRKGARVGILDADIYGPSLPTMISPEDSTVRKSRTTPHFIQPIEYEGVKCMSFGFVNQKAAPGAGGRGAAVMRGAMVSKVIDQLILATEWGELDYLIVDMPPGTGDIQISISQQMAVSASVIVTTPQKLSFVDVEKGIAMFEDIKIPTAAIVENMSYFDCIHGHRHYPFGHGHLKELSNQYDVQNTFQMPILEELSAHSDAGKPLVLQDSAVAFRKTYDELSEKVAEQLVKFRYQTLTMPILSFDSSQRLIVLRLFGSGSAKEVLIHPRELRAMCQCAACIDEFSGKSILDPASISEEIIPEKIQQKGNYAYAITWSDQHSSSLYTFDFLASFAQEQRL